MDRLQRWVVCLGVALLCGLGKASAAESSFFKSMVASAPDEHSLMYTVQSGDTLTAIAKKHAVTVGLLQRINPSSSKRLMPGMSLKIPTYKLTVWVDKSENTLLLKGDGEELKSYSVSTGSNNSTPVGTFTVTDKLVHPTWYTAGAVVPSGSPKNILGTRWIGLSIKSYGIHGTTEPEKLGQQVTAGCIRMKNDEVEELYDLLPPGTPVTVVD